MNAIVPANQNLDLTELQRTGKLLAASGYFPVDRNPDVAVAQVVTKILAGRELGYGPFASVQGIHVIQGRPVISANLMASAVKNHPRYDYRVRVATNEEVSIEFFECHGDGKRESLGVSTFTMTDARTAGLGNKDNWAKFPRNMLFARAMSNGVRFFVPDVFNGNTVYVADELGVDEDGEGNLIEATPRIVSAPDASQDVVFESIQPTAEQSNGATSQPPKASRKTLKHLHALGVELYGKDRWDDIRHRNTKRVTGGRTESSLELTEEEARKLIAGMEKLRQAPAAAQEQRTAQQPNSDTEVTLEDAEPLPF